MARKTKMNKITSAKKTALINKNNLQLKNEFLSYEIYNYTRRLQSCKLYGQNS